MRKFVVKLSMKLLTLIGLVMSVLAYSALTTSLENAALRSNDRMPMYIHPTWMPREMGAMLGNPDNTLIVPIVVSLVMVVFWASMMKAASMVRREFPREAY